MLSISNPISGGGSMQYYEELALGEYYTGNGQSSGRWWGRGANWLKLTGAVQTDAFRQLLLGYSPDGTRKLVQNAGHPRRQMGWDQTFSAPKDPSALWAFGSAKLRTLIEIGQQRAVAAALNYLQDQAGQTRRGPGGRIREKAGLVFATFLETVSRELDPQLHTHAVLVNVGVRQDGTTGALWSHEFFLQKMRAGAIYRAELAAYLAQHLGVHIEPRAVGFGIAGVPQELSRAFSKRRAAVERRLDRWNDHSAVAAKAAVINTRPSKRHLPREVLQARWEATARQYGWSAEKVAALIGPARRARRSLQQLVERFYEEAGRLPVAQRTTKALLALANRLVLEAYGGGAYLRHFIEQVLPRWTQAAGVNAQSARSRKTAGKTEGRAQDATRTRPSASPSDGTAQAAGSRTQLHRAAEPRTTPTAERRVSVSSKAIPTSVVVPQPSAHTPTARQLVAAPSDKSIQVGHRAAASASFPFEDQPAPRNAQERWLIAHARARGILKEGVSRYVFTAQGHLAVTTSGVHTVVRPPPARQAAANAPGQPGSAATQRRVLQQARDRGWLNPRTTEQRFSPAGVLWLKQKPLTLAVSSLPPPPGRSLKAPDRVRLRASERRLLDHVQARGLVREGRSIQGFDAEGRLWVKDQDLNVSIAWQPWAQKPAPKKATASVQRVPLDNHEKRRLEDLAVKSGFAKDRKQVRWSDHWQTVVDYSGKVPQIIPRSALREPSGADPQLRRSFEQWVGRMHPENQTRERLERVAHWLARKTGADRRALRELLQDMRPGAERRFLHVAWHHPLAQAPFQGLRALAVPHLALGMPPHKWDKILWAKNVPGGQVRLQMQRLFPRSPRWNPLHRWALPALRLTQERATLGRQQPSPTQAEKGQLPPAAKRKEAGHTATQRPAMEHGY